MKMFTTHCPTHTILLFSLILPLLLISVAGCSSSRTTPDRLMTSFPDPDFLGKRYNRIAIHFNSLSLYERQVVETALVDLLHKREVGAVTSTSIIAPTRRWDSASMFRALSGAGIDGYMHITEIERSVDSSWVPVEEVVTTTRKGEERKVPRERRAEEETGQDSVVRYTETEETRTSTKGGYWRTHTWRNYRVELVDLPSGRIAWLGTTGLWGSVDNSSADMGERITGQLGQDGMITLR